MNARDKLYKKYKKTANENILNQYKVYRNKINNLTSELKQKYYKNLIDQNKNNSKKLWQTINEYSNSNKTKTSGNIKEIMSENGLLITDNKKIVDIFNNHYATIGEKMAHNILNYNNAIDERNALLPNKLNSIFLSPVDEKEIKDIIDSLKNNASPGIDNITTEILKAISNKITKPLCHIINLIFTKAICPSHFKIAIIKPIYKKGDRNKVENYRPISLISNVAKIFEKALKNRIERFLTKYSLLSSLQFGFRNNKSTNDASCTSFSLSRNNF